MAAVVCSLVPCVAGGACDAATRVISGVVRDVISDCDGCLALRCARARVASVGDCLVCAAAVPGVTSTCGGHADKYCSAAPPPPVSDPVDCAYDVKQCVCSQCDCSTSSAWPCGGGGGGCACAGTTYCSCGGICRPVLGFPCTGSGHRRLGQNNTNSREALSVGDMLQVSGMLANVPTHPTADVFTVG
jgi:hypothetical protein